MSFDLFGLPVITYRCSVCQQLAPVKDLVFHLGRGTGGWRHKQACPTPARKVVATNG